MKLVFVRHGQTNYNVLNLCNNNPDIDVYLTEKGKAQAEIVGEKLKDRRLDIIFVSLLKRTRQTAEIINKFHSSPVVEDARLGDRITGMEGRPVPDFHKAVEKDPLNMKLSGGESFMEAKERVISFLEDLKNSGYNSVLVVTHSPILKIAKAHFSGIPDGETLNQSAGNCELFEVEI